jgi:hypothetical protein
MSPFFMAARERQPPAVDCRWGSCRNHSPAAHQGPSARPPVAFREVEARGSPCHWGLDYRPHPAIVRRTTPSAGLLPARLDPIRRMLEVPGLPARRRPLRAPRPARRREARPMRGDVGGHAYATPLPEATLLQPRLAAWVPSKAKGACQDSGRYTIPLLHERRLFADSLTSSGVSYAREAWQP